MTNVLYALSIAKFVGVSHLLNEHLLMIYTHTFTHHTTSGEKDDDFSIPLRWRTSPLYHKGFCGYD
jgi:hypothetical protein